MALLLTHQGLRQHAARPTGGTSKVCSRPGPSHQDDALWYGQGSRLGLRFDTERFELRHKTFSALAFLLRTLAFLLYWSRNPEAVRVIEAQPLTLHALIGSRP